MHFQWRHDISVLFRNVQRLLGLEFEICFMSFPQGGGFLGNTQQQLAQLAQQQQHMQARQQAFQTQQHNLQPFPKSQQEYLQNLTPQQLQALLNQKSQSMQPGTHTGQYPQPSMLNTLNQGMPIPGSSSGVTNSQQASMNNVMLDMVNKAKAGLLNPVQLSHLRAILEQQSSQSNQQPMTPKVMMPANISAPGSMPAMQRTVQAMPMKQSMMMQNQGTPTAISQAALNPVMDASKLQQQQQQQSPQQQQQQSQQHQTNMLQGLQFVQKIQQRISEIEQKLASTTNDLERQSLHHNRQELHRVQATLIQKLTQGSQIQQPVSTSSSPLIGGLSNPLVTSFAQTNVNTPSSKSSVNLMNGATMNMPSVQPYRMQNMPTTAPNAPASNVSLSPEQFKRALMDLMHRHGKAVQMNPVVNGREVDLYQLFTLVQSFGGSKTISQNGRWASVAASLGFVSMNQTQLVAISLQLSQVYKNYLELFEEVWNRALLHQISISNSVPMAKSNISDSLQANSTSMNQNNATQSPRFSTLMQNPSMPATTPNSFPSDQLTPMPPAPEHLSNVVQPQTSQFSSPIQLSAKAPNMHSVQMKWPIDQSVSTPAPQASQQRSTDLGNLSQQAPPNKSSPEKQRQSSIKVTTKMLEEARSLLNKIDLSLSMSRPKLPIIESIQEEEKAMIFQQVQSLVPLKATVLALLPVFLAMTKNVEPAKRVKIMICIFEDQVALLPQKQCILKLADLEKLKVQMTRCIGFVRLNDEKLAQKIIAKTLSAQTDQARPDESQDNSRNETSPLESSKQNRVNTLTPGKAEDDEIEITAANIRTGGKDFGHDEQSNGKDEKSIINTEVSSKLVNKMRSDRSADATDQAVQKLIREQNRNQDLSNSAPIQFVEKAWKELIMVEAQNKETSISARELKNGFNDEIAWPNGSFASYVFSAMNLPYPVGNQGHDKLFELNQSTPNQRNESSGEERSSVILGKRSGTLPNCNDSDTARDLWGESFPINEESQQKNKNYENENSDWWTNENLFNP